MFRITRSMATSSSSSSNRNISKQSAAVVAPSTQPSVKKRRANKKAIAPVPFPPIEGVKSETSQASLKDKKEASTAVAVAVAVADLKRTESFQPVSHFTFHPDVDAKDFKIHTLLLGTHPSIKSLEESQYFGHPMK